MDFSFPSPQLNHFFCLALAKPEGEKKTLHDASNMSCEHWSQTHGSSGQALHVHCCPVLSMGFGAPASPRTVHLQIRVGFIWAKIEPIKTHSAALALG